MKLVQKLNPINYLKSFFTSEKPPHHRFAGFLTVFSFMWLAIGILFSLNLIEKINHNESAASIGGSAAAMGFPLLFFFLYRYASRVLKQYDTLAAEKFQFLKYINPVAPMVYISTILIIVLIILNLIMLALFAAGFMIWLILVLITFGLITKSDSFSIDYFIGLPQAFFKLENSISHYISPTFLIIYLFLIYFIIPFSVTGIILWKHQTSKR